VLDPVKKKIIGVGSGEEEDANRRRKESPRRDGLLNQRADRETVCSGNQRADRETVCSDVDGSRGPSTVKDG